MVPSKNKGMIFWLCPLYSFTCNCGSIELTNGLTIQKAPKQIQTFLKRKYPEESRQAIDNVLAFDWVMATPDLNVPLKETLNIDRDVWTNSLALFFLNSFIWSLRLLKSGCVTPGYLVCFSQQKERYSAGTVIETYLTKRGCTREPIYILSEEDKPLLNKLLNDIISCMVTGKLLGLDLALIRFNSAYNGEPSQKLIDQMIAFESLFIGDDKELSYKLALRTAFFLDKNKESVFNDMKKAYSLRGKIVHGLSFVDKDVLQNLIPKMEEYLRQSLLKYILLLVRGMSLKEIRAKLDENILSNGNSY